MASIVSRNLRNIGLLIILSSVLLSHHGSSANKDIAENQIQPELKDPDKETDKEVCLEDKGCILQQESRSIKESIPDNILNVETISTGNVDTVVTDDDQEQTDSNNLNEVVEDVNSNSNPEVFKNTETVSYGAKTESEDGLENPPLIDKEEDQTPNTEAHFEQEDDDNLKQNNETSNSTIFYDWFKYFMDSFLEEFKEGVTIKQPEIENTTNSTNANISRVLNETLDLNVSIISPPKPVDLSNDTQTAVLNTTEGGKKLKFECVGRNMTDSNVNSTVKIITSAKLLQLLSFDKNETENITDCIVVMFYAPWCKFCAKTAPHFNALARAFPQLDFLAVDTAQFSNILARFGTVSVPNVLVFHQSRSTLKFNQTERVFDNFVSFLKNTTGLEPNASVIVSDEDYRGPVPSIPTDDSDYLLLVSWIFVIFCSTCMFIKSTKGQQWITRVRVLWQEHQHID